MASNQLPLLDPENRAFWTRGEVGELAICRCQHCARFIHPPMPACPACGADDVTPTPVSGRGHVESYSVNYQPWLTGQEVPFVLAVVELEEQPGLWLMTNIVDCEPTTVHVGMPVQVCFRQQGDVWLPLFSPREAACA